MRIFETTSYLLAFLVSTALHAQAPSPRRYHLAVAAGNKMFIFGGDYQGDDRTVRYLSGGIFDTETKRWAPFAPPEDIPGAKRYPAVEGTMTWTGSEILLWGGSWWDSVESDPGLRFNPATSSWSVMSTNNAPTPRDEATSLWTGDELLVWGGVRLLHWPHFELPTDGGIYSPSQDRWTRMSEVGAPEGRKWGAVIWTGKEMIVWGGYRNTNGVEDPKILNDGAIYNRSTNKWRPISKEGAPSARFHFASVWTGTEMIVFGGYDDAVYSKRGAIYNPVTDKWRPMSRENAPSPRVGLSMVWTGEKAVVWGGQMQLESYRDGGVYDPVTDSWEAISQVGAPGATVNHTAVMVGDKMLVWGGYYWSKKGMEYLDNKVWTYDPKVNRWIGAD